MHDVIIAASSRLSVGEVLCGAERMLRPAHVLKTELASPYVEAVRLCGVDASIPEYCTAVARLHERAHALHADLLVVPAGLSIRRFRAVCFDMDGTLVENECIDEMAALIGKGEEVAAVTKAAMEGRLPFAENLALRVKVMRGFPKAFMPEANAALRLMPGAGEWIDFLKTHGVEVAVVTGGFEENAADIAGRLGIRHWSANRLVWDAEDRLTGDVVGPGGGSIQDASGKRTALMRYAAMFGTSPECMIAAGDGANDVEMVGIAGFGLAYKPKPVLRRAAAHAVLFGPLSAAKLAFAEAWA